jgi:hypothetical protein
MGLVFNNCGIANNIILQGVGANVQSEIGVWQKIKYSKFIHCSLFARKLLLIALVVHFVHDILFFVLCISIV